MAIKNKILLPLYMVLIWSVAKIYKSYIVINYQVNPTAFSLISLLAASVVLIAYGRTNIQMLKLAFKEKQSWIFAIFDILSNITLMIMFFYVGSTRSSYLCQLCTVTAIGYSFIKYKRKVEFYDLFAILLILSGMFYALSEAKEEYIPVLLSCTILSAIFLTGKTLSAEFNPLNQFVMDYQARMKIAGIAVALSSIFMATIIISAKIFAPVITIENRAMFYIINSIPSLDDFLYLPTIISALIYGIVLLVTSRYIYFKSSKVSSTETLLTIAALSPLGTLILEYLAFNIGIFETTEINIYDVYICILMSIGVIVLTLSRNKDIFALSDRKIRKILSKNKVA